ncbi:MAG: lipoprotein, partial [Aeromonas veronii]
MKKIVIGGLIALLLTGCSKLNRENYDQLKMGMSYAE